MGMKHPDTPWRRSIKREEQQKRKQKTHEGRAGKGKPGKKLLTLDEEG